MMRVIAQNGRLDIPYEAYALRVEKTAKTYAVTAVEASAASCGASAVFILAEYKSLGTALEALEKLHAAYKKCILTKGGPMANYSVYAPPFGFVAPKVWQFPEEDHEP